MLQSFCRTDNSYLLPCSFVLAPFPQFVVSPFLMCFAWQAWQSPWFLQENGHLQFSLSFFSIPYLNLTLVRSQYHVSRDHKTAALLALTAYKCISEPELYKKVRDEFLSKKTG